MPQSGSSQAGMLRTGGLVPIAMRCLAAALLTRRLGRAGELWTREGLHVDVCDVSHFLFAASEENQQLEINGD